MEKKKDIVHSSEINSKSDFGSFYSTYYKRFVRYAFYYVNNQQAAEDITHDVILYYWEHRNKVTEDTDVLGYILLAIRNKCLNYLKRLQLEDNYNKKHLELHQWEIKARIMTLEDTDYANIFTKDIIDIVTTSLNKLPRQTKYIFIQNRLENKPRKEIAAEMGVSLQKIDYHIKKANELLFKYLKDYLPVILFFSNFLQ